MKIAPRTLVVIMFALCLRAVAVHAQGGPNGDERKLLNLVNQERQTAGLSTLQWDYHLAESARAHTLGMVQHRQLSHQLPGEPGLGDRVAVTGVRFSACAENVATAPTVERGHDALMHSPGHRANILNADYNAVGLALIPRDGELYITQNFAHVLPVYSESQFRDAVVAAFNRARRANSVPELKGRADADLARAACSGSTDPGKLIATIPGATDLQIFTASTPEKLPSHMQEAAADSTLRRMNIGACFQPGKDHGFASFVVVVAFFGQP
jgi:uncharacterized protein YkwD